MNRTELSRTSPISPDTAVASCINYPRASNGQILNVFSTDKPVVLADWYEVRDVFQNSELRQAPREFYMERAVASLPPTPLRDEFGDRAFEDTDDIEFEELPDTDTETEEDSSHEEQETICLSNSMNVKSFLTIRKNKKPKNLE